MRKHARVFMTLCMTRPGPATASRWRTSIHQARRWDSDSPGTRENSDRQGRQHRRRYDARALPARAFERRQNSGQESIEDRAHESVATGETVVFGGREAEEDLPAKTGGRRASADSRPAPRRGCPCRAGSPDAGGPRDRRKPNQHTTQRLPAITHSDPSIVMASNTRVVSGEAHACTPSRTHKSKRRESPESAQRASNRNRTAAASAMPSRCFRVGTLLL